MSCCKSDLRFDRMAVLRNAQLFGALSDHVLSEVARRALYRELRAGEMFFVQDDVPTGLYVVVSGELRLLRRAPEGTEQVLFDASSGAILASVAVFDGGRLYYSAVASTACSVLDIQPDDIHELCRQYPELFRGATHLLCQKVRHLAELVETLTFDTVNKRLARYLVAVCIQSGAYDGDVAQLQLTMTQSEVASHIGSTREGVCRALHQLEKWGC